MTYDTHDEVVDFIFPLANSSIGLAEKKTEQEVLSLTEYQQHLNYWDYLNIDMLISLQNTQTNLPDEKLFLVFHQITELYFNLVLHDLTQLLNKQQREPEDWFKTIKRLNSHWGMINTAFDELSEQLDIKQFKTFRHALSSASGFQSCQYRKIELLSTPINNLITYDRKAESKCSTGHTNPVDELYPYIYWKNIKTASNPEKNIMLKNFEDKYDEELFEFCREAYDKNLWTLFLSEPNAIFNNTRLRSELRQYDYNINVLWGGKHYRLATKYLAAPSGNTIESTGKTDWQKILMPNNKRLSFFPDLWSQQEHDNWGCFSFEEEYS